MSQKDKGKDPIGRNTLHLSPGQVSGLDKNPPAIDAANGILVDATNEFRSSPIYELEPQPPLPGEVTFGQRDEQGRVIGPGKVGYAPLPNSGSYDKKRMLQKFDEAKKAWRAKR